MKIYLVLIILFFISSCGSYTKTEKHNLDFEELKESISKLKNKEYQMKLTIDSMNSQLILLENQIIRIKKKLKTNNFSITKDKTNTPNEDNLNSVIRSSVEINSKNKLTQDEILKITKLSKKEEVEEPIVLTNSMLGNSYVEHHKSKNNHTVKKEKIYIKSKKSKKHFIKTMKIEYANALKLYRENKFDKSITAFNNLIKKYSKVSNSLTDNLYYWLGENYLSLQDIPLSRKNFEIVIKKYPRANKVPDSMFKLGFILEQEGRAEVAVSKYYNLLVKKYLNTEAGKLAKERLQKLKQ